MKPERLHWKTRKEWLSSRNDVGIGGSEASAVLGLSPWMTAHELWEVKTGRTKAKDLSDKESVQKGIRFEPALRELYKAIHPDARVEHYACDMLYQTNRPWLFATLDGEVEIDGRKGVLEIKTATPTGKAGWEKWDKKIPDYYYAQCIHQLCATGYDFVDVLALLFQLDGSFTIREYRIEAKDCQEDMAYLVEKETEFWDSVIKGCLPPMTVQL